MGNPKDELRKMIESTAGQVYDDWKNKRVFNANTVEELAPYALREIEKNMVGNGHEDDAREPWADMSTLELWKEIALWSLTKQFTVLKEQDSLK